MTDEATEIVSSFITQLCKLFQRGELLCNSILFSWKRIVEDNETHIELIFSNTGPGKPYRLCPLLEKIGWEDTTEDIGCPPYRFFLEI